MKYTPPIGGAANDPYIDGNPALGVEGSAVPAAAIEHGMREIVNVISTAGLVPSEANLTQLYTAISTMIAGSVTDTFKNNFLHVREEQASGTNGTVATLNTYTNMVLNTVKTNTISGASLSGNQVTLPAGTYHIEGIVPYVERSAAQGRAKCKIRNVTDSTDIIIGHSSASFYDGNGQWSFVSGRFTLAASKTISLMARLNAADKWGEACTHGDIEVYSDLKIWKV